MHCPNLELPKKGTPRYGKYDQMEQLTKQLKKTGEAPEALKANDQMEWVGAANNTCNAAEENVLHEVIYSESVSQRYGNIPLALCVS